MAQIASFFGEEIGGAENSISILLSALSKHGIQMEIFSTRSGISHIGGKLITFTNFIPKSVINVGSVVAIPINLGGLPVLNALNISINHTNTDNPAMIRKIIKPL